MKWLKHFSDAHDDEKLSEVLCIHGAKAYGVFWLIVESVASQMDQSDRCSARYHYKKWATIAHVDRRTLTRYLHTFNILTLIVSQECDNFVTIEIPKLLLLRDNYTKDLQATTRKTSKQEVEVEVERTKPDKYVGDFDRIWKRYPNKAGKTLAEKRFKSTVTSAEKEKEIHLALDTYLEHLRVEDWKKPQNGGTWFGQWGDWFEYEQTAQVNDGIHASQRFLLEEGRVLT